MGCTRPSLRRQEPRPGSPRPSPGSPPLFRTLISPQHQNVRHHRVRVWRARLVQDPEAPVNGELLIERRKRAPTNDLSSPSEFPQVLLRTRRRDPVHRATRPELRTCRPVCRAPTSCCDRRVIQPMAVRLPAIRTETRARAATVWSRCRRSSGQPRMNAVPVVGALELEELPLQVGGRPKERAVQTLPSNRANQPFDEGMGQRRVRHGLDFLHVEDAQVRLPLVELVESIMVRTQVRRWRVATSRPVEPRHHGARQSPRSDECTGP